MERPRPSFVTADSNSPANDSSPGQDSSGPDNVPKREDLRASAEKILYTYLLPGSEREIIIPQGILHDVQEAIEGPAQRSDPELFDAAKDYVFQAMERDAFPGFLNSKALGNLVPPSMMLRLIVGLLAMFGGFWAAFILIFLNKPRYIRCWVSVLFYGCIVNNLINKIMTGRPTLHDRDLCPYLPAVYAGPNPSICGLQRIHLYVIRAHP